MPNTDCGCVVDSAVPRVLEANGWPPKVEDERADGAPNVGWDVVVVDG